MSSTRMKTIRLARLNPGFMRRLEEEESHRVPWMQPSSIVHAGSHRSSSSGPCLGLARVQSEMAQLRAELAAQRLILTQERELTLKEGKVVKPVVRREEVRRRAFCGGRAWAATSDRSVLLPVLCVWHMAVKHRRDLGLLQAKLFEEEACRGMALRQQKVELDVLHMEAEARYMEAMSSRVSEAEMRMAHAEEVARRFAAEDEENNLDSSSLESRAALHTLQAQADARLADAEARHAEALLAEREVAEFSPCHG